MSASYEERVKAWGEEAWEKFTEMAGKHLSDRVRPAMADQLAYLELVKERKG